VSSISANPNHRLPPLLPSSASLERLGVAALEEADAEEEEEEDDDEEDEEDDKEDESRSLVDAAAAVEVNI